MGGNSQFDVSSLAVVDVGSKHGLGLESLHGKALEMSLGRLVILSSVILLLGGSACLRASDDCLSCHGPSTGLTNSQGKPITVKAEALAHSVHKDVRCVDCHAGAANFPHTAKSASASCLACHGEVSGELVASAHAALGKPDSSETCMACHGDAHEVVGPSTRGTAFCATCHADEVKQFATSVHGRAHAHLNGDAPTCQSCHGLTHRVVAAGAPNSPVSKLNLPRTCGQCHSNPALAAKYLFTVAKPVEAYESSVHGRAIQAGKMNAAVCNDCHGVHDIFRRMTRARRFTNPGLPRRAGSVTRRFLVNTRKAFTAAPWRRALILLPPVQTATVSIESWLPTTPTPRFMWPTFPA